MKRIALNVRRSAGFTLVEIMITVVIVTILLAIAIPTYSTQVRKSRRTEARTAILDIAGREERYLSVSNAYTNVASNLGYAAAGSPALLAGLTVGSGYYSVTVTTTAAAPPAGPGFSITALPIAGTSQAKDAACQSFTVDNTGKQSSATAGGVDTTSTCWQ